MTMKENIFIALSNMSQIMYGSNEEVATLLSGDLAKIFNLAIIIDYAVDFEEHKIERNVKFKIEEDNSLWVKEPGCGGSFIGTRAPSNRAIEKAIKVVSTPDHYLREFCSRYWEVPEILNVEII